MNTIEALDILKNQGFKYTDKRKFILDFFEKENRYCTAKDLFECMDPKYKGISFDTIYRNLHLFHELDILESTELDGEKHFRLKCDHHHHHHFICKNCGVTKDIHHCPMDQISQELKSFLIDDHKFEIYGFCPTCQ